MSTLDLIKKAIDFAMTDLCESHLDMPCGCDGCPYGNVRRDDDGNLHDDDYLFNPYSGVGYKLRHTHELNPECPIAEYEEDEGTVGVHIYDTAEDAIEAWNRRVDNG